ncbi:MULTISPECIES: hypothetical protein [Brevundimonas]|jgi:hypothetical protein|uniref:hypothetical protein n=1 Tax=Brevundimonas TaxID=41275 RepID=UPI00035F6BF9|nr:MULTISPECIES: hypothetical protein [Brevundimonas]MBK1976581.1 hypothetical protein [Brevundimonas diminuta]MCW0046325.1 hypothetical protein [Brevundimonas sp. BT-123]QCQ98021.1 hypothetical protein E7T10_04735 [Brevundimonas sp. SGAir0440]
MPFQPTPRPTPPAFGKRRVPPLTAEQKAALVAKAEEAARAAWRARQDAYLEARFQENMAKLRASIGEAEHAVARRRLGAMGGEILRGLAGFAVGLRLGC